MGSRPEFSESGGWTQMWPGPSTAQGGGGGSCPVPLASWVEGGHQLSSCRAPCGEGRVIPQKEAGVRPGGEADAGPQVTPAASIPSSVGLYYGAKITGISLQVKKIIQRL